jgi:hypothetical protein
MPTKLLAAAVVALSTAMFMTDAVQMFNTAIGRC